MYYVQELILLRKKKKKIFAVELDEFGLTRTESPVTAQSKKQASGMCCSRQRAPAPVTELLIATAKPGPWRSRARPDLWLSQHRVGASA